LDDADQIGRIGQIAVVQDEAPALLMRIAVQMVDAIRIERRGAAFDAVHRVTLFEQQLGQIGTVLSGDTGDQGNFSSH